MRGIFPQEPDHFRHLFLPLHNNTRMDPPEKFDIDWSIVLSHIIAYFPENNVIYRKIAGDFIRPENLLTIEDAPIVRNLDF